MHQLLDSCHETSMMRELISCLATIKKIPMISALHITLVESNSFRCLQRRRYAVRFIKMPIQLELIVRMDNVCGHVVVVNDPLENRRDLRLSKKDVLDCFYKNANNIGHPYSQWQYNTWPPDRQLPENWNRLKPVMLLVSFEGIEEPILLRIYRHHDQRYQRCDRKPCLADDSCDWICCKCGAENDYFVHCGYLRGQCKHERCWDCYARYSFREVTGIRDGNFPKPCSRIVLQS